MPTRPGSNLTDVEAGGLVLLQGAYTRSDGLDLEFLREHPSVVLSSSPFSPGKSLHLDHPRAPTPTHIPSRFAEVMWLPDDEGSFSSDLHRSEEPPSPASEYTTDSPTLSMISSPSTVLPSVAFTRSLSSVDDSHPALFTPSCSRPHSRSTPAHLPLDSSQLSDSYSFRSPHQHLVPPALSSADSSSASTRSSAYTNPGSAVASIDYGHIHVASGDDEEPVGVGITSDDVVQLLGQDASPSAISSSRVPIDQGFWSQPYLGSTRSRSSSVANSRGNSLTLSLSSKPSLDAVWRPLDERDEDGLMSEDETDEEPSIDEIDEEDEEQEEQATSAMLIAEEGLGVIVSDEGMPIVELQAKPGTTHLLIGSATTPNAVPSFLSNTLPNICDTLLALDVSANFLGALPPALASCGNLEELNITSNPLRALPIFLCNLTSLRVLIADATGINTLPEPLIALEKLHTLSLRRNKMHSLPSWLCILPSLETLLIDGNPFQGPWKALVDPLLARAFSSPIYPPSTPISPPLLASTQSTMTAASETDTEDYDESPQPDQEPHYVLPEDDTITPARARIGRAATSPYPNESPPSRPGGGLTRNRTTPNRAYYDKGRPNPAVEDFIQDEPSPQTLDDSGYFGDTKIRRMKSAGELRHSPTPLGSPVSAPQIRPSLSQYTTSVSSSNLLTTPPSSPPSEPKVPPNRFASLGATGSPSRISSGKPRPQLNPSIWDALPLEEEKLAESSTTSPPAHRKSLIKPWHTSPPKQATTQDPQVERTGGRARKEEKEKDRSSRWGFLKKMSMGKMRTDTPPFSRPGSSQARPQIMPSTKPDLRPAPYPTPGSPDVNPPHINVRISTTGALDSPHLEYMAPSEFATHAKKASIDGLKQMPPISAVSSHDHLLPSPSPLTSRAAKRRSFLPIDVSPAPIPTASAFIPGMTVTDDGDEGSDDARATPSPRSIPTESYEHIQRREEERAREAYTRALRSVMAYLRDMHDLGLSQTNVLSMYGSPLEVNGGSRSRQPTVLDGARSASENSVSSSTTAWTTESSAQLRPVDSRGGLRSGSETMTNSMVTIDSPGSGGIEERKSKDDKDKRARIVREIIETERTYVKGLQELVDIYIKPACAPVNVLTGVGKETVIPSAERKIVFSGLESLFSFHKESFLPALETAAAPLMQTQEVLAKADPNGELSLNVARTVANSFVSHAAFMRMYSTYINNFDNSVQRIKYWVSDRAQAPSTANSMSPSSSTAHLVGLGMGMSAIGAPSMAAESPSSNGLPLQLSSSQRKRIKSYLKRCRMNPRHCQLNLEGYLLLPVQRIPRYRMLLEELCKSTRPVGDYIGDPIDRALSEISSLAMNMNEGKRESESRRKLVQWQSRIRGKFPSPLVQPHRRLIMDGHLSLTRVVRKACVAFEVIDSHGDASTVQVECLAPEMTPRALIGILCNDLLVLCRDPTQGQDPNSPVDLWAVLRMQTLPQPASIVHGNALRLVDNKAVLYFDAPSTSDALNWFRAINLHIPASKS